MAYQNGRAYIINGRMCLCFMHYTFALVIKAKHYERNSNHRKGRELHHGERR